MCSFCFSKEINKCQNKNRCCRRTLNMFWWNKTCFLQVAQITPYLLMLPNFFLCTLLHQTHHWLLLFIYLNLFEHHRPPQSTNQSISLKRREASANNNESHHSKSNSYRLLLGKETILGRKALNASWWKVPVHQSRTWWREKVIVVTGTWSTHDGQDLRCWQLEM